MLGQRAGAQASRWHRVHTVASLAGGARDRAQKEKVLKPVLARPRNRVVLGRRVRLGQRRVTSALSRDDQVTP